MKPSDASVIRFTDGSDTVAQRNAALDILNRLQRFFGQEKSLTEIQHEITEERLLMGEPDQHQHLLDKALKDTRIAEKKARDAQRAAEEANDLIQRYKESQ